MEDIIRQRFTDSISVKQAIVENNKLITKIEKAALLISDCLRNGNKIVLCGNGGSASDALHFAGEIVGRFQKERTPWPAVVLNADVATMTAIANDYGYEEIFARQAKGHMREGDVFIGISTSGNSDNIIRAVTVAKETGCKTIGMLGKDGGKLANTTDIALIVPCEVTARVQESHITIIHIICEIVEELMAKNE